VHIALIFACVVASGTPPFARSFVPPIMMTKCGFKARAASNAGEHIRRFSPTNALIDYLPIAAEPRFEMIWPIIGVSKPLCDRISDAHYKVRVQRVRWRGRLGRGSVAAAAENETIPL